MMPIDTTIAMSGYDSARTNALISGDGDTAKKEAQRDAALKETTDAFEAFLVKEVLDIAINPEQKSELFPTDAGDKIYRSMYNDTMSRALSGNLGFSEMLFDYLKLRSG